MGRQEVSIRAARAEDAAPIHALHAACVGDSFAGLLGDDRPTEEERTERERSWCGPIGSPLPRHSLRVAERRGRVVGLAAVGPTRDADGDRETTAELRTVMVDRDERGTGVGSALVAAGEQDMRRAGFRVAKLWVVPENAAAVRCYERSGWTLDGTERIMRLGDRRIPAVRYEKRLD